MSTKSWWSQILDLVAAWLSGVKVPPVPVPTPSPTPVPTPTPTPSPAPSGDLVDPNPTKYTASYMNLNADREECGYERDHGRNGKIRFSVWIPSKGLWWYISSLAEGQVSVTDGTMSCPDFVRDGYSYHVRGWMKPEPGPHDHSPKLDWLGDNCYYDGSYRVYPIVECRKA